MSKFIYSPEGIEPKTWEWDPRKLMSPEAELIERLTGMTFAEWGAAIDRGSILALHAILFVYLRRENPKLEWDEVQFNLSEVAIDLEDEDKPADDGDPEAPKA